LFEKKFLTVFDGSYHVEPSDLAWPEWYCDAIKAKFVSNWTLAACTMAISGFGKEDLELCEERDEYEEDEEEELERDLDLDLDL